MNNYAKDKQFFLKTGLAGMLVERMGALVGRPDIAEVLLAKTDSPVVIKDVA